MASSQRKAPLALQAEIDHRKSSEPRTVAFGRQPSSTAPTGPELAEEQEAIYGHQRPGTLQPSVQGKVWREACHLTYGRL